MARAEGTVIAKDLPVLLLILAVALASIPLSDALIRWADWHPWRAMGRLIGRVCLWRWRREIGPVTVTPAMIERLRAGLEHESGSIDVLRLRRAS